MFGSFQLPLRVHLFCICKINNLSMLRVMDIHKEYNNTLLHKVVCEDVNYRGYPTNTLLYQRFQQTTRMQ